MSIPLHNHYSNGVFYPHCKWHRIQYLHGLEVISNMIMLPLGVILELIGKCLMLPSLTPG